MSVTPAANFFDKIGMRYEESFGHDVGLLDFTAASLALLPANASVLDIGCGTGKPISSMVVSSGRKLHGIDFSSVMVELSRKQVPGGTFELANLTDFKAQAPFDAAFTSFSIFHRSRGEMDHIAKKFSEWISPGGYLFIATMVADDFETEPHMFDADGVCARGIEHRFMGNRVGNLLYTRLGWKQLLTKFGFEVLKTDMVPFQPPPEAECDLELHYYITARKSTS